MNSTSPRSSFVRMAARSAGRSRPDRTWTDGGAHLVRDDVRERRLAETGRTEDQDVVERFAARAGRANEDVELLLDRPLADVLVEPHRSQRPIERTIRDPHRRVDEAIRLDGHDAVSADRASCLSAARTSSSASGASSHKPVDRSRIASSRTIAERDERTLGLEAAVTSTTAAARRGRRPRHRHRRKFAASSTSSRSAVLRPMPGTRVRKAVSGALHREADRSARA